MLRCKRCGAIILRIHLSDYDGSALLKDEYAICPNCGKIYIEECEAIIKPKKKRKGGINDSNRD